MAPPGPTRQGANSMLGDQQRLTPRITGPLLPQAGSLSPVTQLALERKGISLERVVHKLGILKAAGVIESPLGR